jgi:hypothetical protein
MNYAFLIAGGISAFGLIWHVMLGRSRPLLPPLAPEDRLLQLDAFFGRHAVALILAVMTLSFAHASRRPAADDLAYAVSALALLLAALRVYLATRVRAPRLDLSEWAPLALAGAAGVIGLQFR